MTRLFLLCVLLAVCDSTRANPPRDCGALLNAVFEAKAAGDLTALERSLGERLRVHPDDYRTCTMLADLYYRSYRADEGLHLFERALELEGPTVRVYMNLAKCQRVLGKLREALESLEGALALRPNDSRALTLYAQILSELGAHDLGLALLNRALLIDPRDPVIARWREILIKRLNSERRTSGRANK